MGSKQELNSTAWESEYSVNWGWCLLTRLRIWGEALKRAGLGSEHARYTRRNPPKGNGGLTGALKHLATIYQLVTHAAKFLGGIGSGEGAWTR